MPECRVTSHLPNILTQTLPAENRILLRFSLLSALAHIAALVILVIWSGGRARFQPPLQVITIDLGHMEQPRQRAQTRVVDPRHHKTALRLPAPVQAQPEAAVKPQLAPASSVPTQTAAAIAAKTSFSPQPSSGVTSGPSLGATEAAVPVSPGTAISAGQSKTIAPSSVATGIRTADKSGIRAGYMQRCRMLIERHKQYPVMARKGMIEGTVLIRGTLTRVGVLSQCIVTRSSGSGQLDNAALRAVRSVDRFPPLPSELQGDELIFELPISFRLSAER